MSWIPLSIIPHLPKSLGRKIFSSSEKQRFSLERKRRFPLNAHMRENFLNGTEQDVFSDSAYGKTQNENQSLTPKENDLDLSAVFNEEELTVTTVHEFRKLKSKDRLQ
jgi:hypothetical protein